MKKILIVNNDYHISRQVVNFAIEIAAKGGATVFGMFVHSLYPENRYDYLFPNDLNLENYDSTIASEKEQHLQYEQDTIQLFKDMCNTAGVTYEIRTIHANFLDSLVDQSAFADVMICDADKAPSQYSIKTLMADAHCPVILVNDDYEKTDSLILTYDDKSSSIHAVKLFTYLFGFFSGYPVKFVSIVSPDVVGIEYADLIREWLPLHYPKAEIVILKGDPKEELARYINLQQNPLVVMGAFGRSSLSRFFKESLANIIADKTNAPIFIAHD